MQINNSKTSIYNYTFKQLETIVVAENLKVYLVRQMYEWLYKKRIENFDDMRNVSKINIAFLKEKFYFGQLNEVKRQEDKDGTVKFLYELADHNKIETVLMKFDYGYSVCVTTQVGCNMGCKFCASGLMKKIRNLTTGEIVQQVLEVQKYLSQINSEARVSNIVIMGIGEPFDNFENVCNFIDIIKNDFGLQIGSRRITISTCGLVNKFDAWIKREPQVGLAISLHAPNDNIRNTLMPINKAFNIASLMDAADDYVKRTNRRITFEYILIANVNDSKENALELVNLLKGKLCYVNIIPYNPVSENGFKRSNKARLFYEILRKNNITATVRMEKGTNIDAACGQLRAKDEGILK